MIYPPSGVTGEFRVLLKKTTSALNTCWISGGEIIGIREGIMNAPILVAGLAAALMTIGHFTIGSKQYLKPMLRASFDDLPKKFNHCVFHYISVYLLLSAISLLVIGLGYLDSRKAIWLVQFIAVNYGVFALVQIVIAATSGIPNALFKFFQWTLFLFVAVFAWVGVVTLS
jgi:hypothetical protein